MRKRRAGGRAASHSARSDDHFRMPLLHSSFIDTGIVGANGQPRVAEFQPCTCVKHLQSTGSYTQFVRRPARPWVR